MRLQGKAVLVTGAARRVGRAIAMALGQRGARVAVHYNHSRAEAERLVVDLRDGFCREALAVKADLAKPNELKRMVETAAKRLGALHVLVNNASIYEKTPLDDASQSDWDRHMDINARAPFFLSQAVAPHMRKAKEGKIINIADWAGLRPYAEWTPYCASKAALLALNAALAKELAPEIQVNAVMPGPVLLPDNSSARLRRSVIEATPLKRIGSPEDVAKAVLFLIESGDFMTGAAIAVDGGRLIA